MTVPTPLSDVVRNASALAPLLVSVGDAFPANEDRDRDRVACGYCGETLGLHAGSDGGCAICTLVLHLDRPRIDQEVRLAWLRS